MIIIPPYLKAGDTIGIVCPAGVMPYEKAHTAITVLQEWGFMTKTGSTLNGQYHYFSGTDEERLNDFQKMMDDDSVKAILCARGGYGVGRIIDQINFKNFKTNPKWIVGFSDITILHSHIFSKYRIASMHAPMAAAFNNGEYKNNYVQSLHKSLLGEKMNYSCKSHVFNHSGSVTGRLVGGNLSLLAHLQGTVSEIKTKNKILFIEDVGEYIYNIDRMMRQLKRGGKLDNLAGLIIGGFTQMRDTDIPFGQTVEEVIRDVIHEYDYPVCFNFPVSHEKENYTLKVGLKYKLTVGKTRVELLEKEG
ncbi:MAG: LD-carboxypeptidase [Ginsengibacter sp.]